MKIFWTKEAWQKEIQYYKDNFELARLRLEKETADLEVRDCALKMLEAVYETDFGGKTYYEVYDTICNRDSKIYNRGFDAGVAAAFKAMVKLGIMKEEVADETIKKCVGERKNKDKELSN